MTKTTHIQTNFIKFLVEKYAGATASIDTIKKDSKSKDSNGDEPIEDNDADAVIEKLLNEYKKVKRHYENNRISN